MIVLKLVLAIHYHSPPLTSKLPFTAYNYLGPKVSSNSNKLFKKSGAQIYVLQNSGDLLA